MHHTSCSFFAKRQNTQVTQPLLQPIFDALQLLAFPKTKITFEREEVSNHQWDSRKYYRAADGDWENCVRSQRAYFEGDWGIIVLCTVFLVSSSINVSIFLVRGWILSVQTSHVVRKSICNVFFFIKYIPPKVKLSRTWINWNKEYWVKNHPRGGQILFCFVLFLMLKNTLEHSRSSRNGMVVWKDSKSQEGELA